jgi:hypothetical protein
VADLAEDELTLLGVAVYAAQRVEFLLYGLAAHTANNAVEFKRDFEELTPETFLGGDIADLRATLGKLVRAFGRPLLIQTPELVEFYQDRNLIVHNYVRVFRLSIRTARREDGPEFLREFIRRALAWEQVLTGLRVELMQAAAIKEGREDEVALLSEADQLAREAFREHAARVIQGDQV